MLLTIAAQPRAKSRPADCTSKWSPWTGFDSAKYNKMTYVEIRNMYCFDSPITLCVPRSKNNYPTSGLSFIWIEQNVHWPPTMESEFKNTENAKCTEQNILWLQILDISWNRRHAFRLGSMHSCTDTGQLVLFVFVREIPSLSDCHIIELIFSLKISVSSSELWSESQTKFDDLLNHAPWMMDPSYRDAHSRLYWDFCGIYQTFCAYSQVMRPSDQKVKKIHI